MKTMIIGYSGAGKSTLASVIAEREEIPVLHMDRVHWLPGWQERAREEEIGIISEFLSENENWVIDGNYTSVLYNERCEAADRIIYLNISRITCLGRALKRYRENKGKTRASMTEGCPEKIDWGFLYWLLFGGRTRKRRKRYRETSKKYPQKMVEIKSIRALSEFYKTLGVKPK